MLLFQHIRSIKTKIILSFITFFILITIIISIVFWFENQKDNYANIFNHFAKISEHVQNIDRYEAHFLRDEINTENFYKTKESSYLSLRKKSVEFILNETQYLLENNRIKTFKAKKDLTILIKNLEKHEIYFQKLIDLILERGFKDYGIEGKMRKSIQKLETSTQKNNIDLTKILMLRRHEKDFIIRKEPQYVHKNEQLWKQLKIEIEKKNIPIQQKSELLTALQEYGNSFFDLVSIEIKIGFNNQTGLKKDLVFTSKTIIGLAENIKEEAYNEIIILEKQRRNSLYFTLLISLIFVVFFVIYISQSLSKPIKQISNVIQEAISNNFVKKNKLELPNTKDEIGRLSHNFAFMLDKVYESIDRITSQNEKIKTQAELVENKQRTLMDSIRYAYQIQQSILPEKLDVLPYFSDFGIIYEPLNVVSGDFYWFSGGNKSSYLAVIDCTGHGVPGAFMCMIANVLLNELIDEKKMDNPAKILELLHEEIVYALSQDKDKNNDGFDIALCKIEHEQDNNFKVIFSGAKMSVYYTDENQNILELRGIRRSVGGLHNDISLNKPFENHTFNIKKGGFIYLHSDGLTDIPNTERKKFGKKRMIECLDKYIQEPLTIQIEKLQESINTYRNNTSLQRDDITFVALQI